VTPDDVINLFFEKKERGIAVISSFADKE